MAALKAAARRYRTTVSEYVRQRLHVAVAERMGVTSILSFDWGFDAVHGLERIAD